jgi:hypothetical protein
MLFLTHKVTHEEKQTVLSVEPTMISGCQIGHQQLKKRREQSLTIRFLLLVPTSRLAMRMQPWETAKFPVDARDSTSIFNGVDDPKIISQISPSQISVNVAYTLSI